MTPPTLAEAILNAVDRMRLTWRMDRTGERFYLEQDEIAHDLEDLARVAEGYPVTRETISERRIG